MMEQDESILFHGGNPMTNCPMLDSLPGLGPIREGDEIKVPLLLKNFKGRKDRRV